MMKRCRVLRPTLRGNHHPNGGEGETYAKAIGSTPMGVSTVGINPEIWEHYKHLYPDEWVKEFQFMVCPDRKHPQGINGFTEDKKENKWGGPATQYDSGLEGCPPTGEGKPFPVKFATDDQLEARARCYAEAEAKSATNNYSQYGRFTLQVAEPSKRFKRCYTVTEIRTPQQEFLREVDAAKIIHWRTGLKMSSLEAQGQPPSSGWLGGIQGVVPEATEAVHRGMVVKISGDDDPELGMRGKDLHNCWAVVVDVLDPWHYVVDSECDEGNLVTIRDTDVKGWIGDQYNDILGLGEERWKSEVLPLIEKVLRRHPR